MSMQVTIVESGGFAGLTRTRTLDSTTLSTDEANTLQALIDTTGFFTLPPTLLAATGADRKSYAITVTLPEQQHTVQTDSLENYPALYDLITFVRSHARS